VRWERQCGRGARTGLRGKEGDNALLGVGLRTDEGPNKLVLAPRGLALNEALGVDCPSVRTVIALLAVIGNTRGGHLQTPGEK
jgi:hypothetical protein